MPKIDLGTTSPTTEDARSKRWVNVPERDLFDFPHPGIRINLVHYGPGKHFVDSDIADFIESRLDLKYQADIRVMRPNQDVVSQNAMNRHGAGSRTGGFVRNPDVEMAG